MARKHYVLGSRKRRIAKAMKTKRHRTPKSRRNPSGNGESFLWIGLLAVAVFVGYKNGWFSSVGIGSTSSAIPVDAGYVGLTISNLPAGMLPTYAQLFASGIAPSSGNVYWSPSTQKAYASSSGPTSAQVAAGAYGTPAQVGWSAAMGPLTSQLIAMQNPSLAGFGTYREVW